MHPRDCLHVCMDGAKEFSQGKLSDHHTSHGIVMG